jgi:hypothetical protein
VDAEGKFNRTGIFVMTYSRALTAASPGAVDFVICHFFKQLIADHLNSLFKSAPQR